MESFSDPPTKPDFSAALGITIIIILLLLGGIYIVLTEKAHLHKTPQVEKITT